MKKYNPKNGYVIALSRKAEEKVGSIILATQARKLKRELEVIATDSDIVKVGDFITIDMAAGSILESDELGDLYAIQESDVIATVEEG